MRVAFHAPLKAPDHPVPSGDRRMARAFAALLTSLGHEVELVSRFRSYDRDGDLARQRRLAVLGHRLARRLANQLAARPPETRPQLWFTYHLYHKAPDYLGPIVAERLGIPYVVAEASVAGRRTEGAWAVGFAASLQALQAADLTLAMTGIDVAGLRSVLPADHLLLFPPFLDAEPFAAARRQREQHRATIAARHGLDTARPWLLTVAMMRADAKRESYRLLAEALARVEGEAWHLLVVGDGEAAPEIRGWLAGFGARVRFLGTLEERSLPPLHAACDLYVWPAVAEAYGMALLEAQAAGLPVLAGEEGGVRDIVADSVTGCLTARRDPEAFAAALVELLRDPPLRARLASAAMLRVAERHALAPARQRLAVAIEQAQRNFAARKAAPCACA